jgi:hypothetical protein
MDLEFFKKKNEKKTKQNLPLAHRWKICNYQISIAIMGFSFSKCTRNLHTVPYIYITEYQNGGHIHTFHDFSSAKGGFCTEMYHGCTCCALHLHNGIPKRRPYPFFLADVLSAKMRFS